MNGVTYLSQEDAREWQRLLAGDIAIAEARLALLSPENALERLRERQHIENRQRFYRLVQGVLTPIERTV